MHWSVKIKLRWMVVNSLLEGDTGRSKPFATGIFTSLCAYSKMPRTIVLASHGNIGDILFFGWIKLWGSRWIEKGMYGACIIRGMILTIDLFQPKFATHIVSKEFRVCGDIHTAEARHSIGAFFFDQVSNRFIVS